MNVMEKCAICPLHHTGRFNVKYCGQLRKHHPDSWYVSVILQYVKALALHYREHAQTISVDDKCIAPLGDPGAPISTSVHHHSQSLSLTISGLAAVDHELRIQGIVYTFSSILCKHS